MPYLGICLGMQLAVIEFARNVCGLAGANSTEFDPDTPHPVVGLITEWLDRDGRSSGATRRPTSAARCAWARSAARSSPARWRASIYGASVNERHRHRYEVNNHYVPQLEAQGYKVSARTPTESLTEIMELPRASVGSSACSSTRSSPRRRAPGIRCSRPTSRPRMARQRRQARTAAERAGMSGRAQAMQLKLAGFEVGLDRPVVPDRRALRDRVARAWRSTPPGACKEITRELGVPFIYKSIVRQGQSQFGQVAFAAPASTRACASSPT